MLLDCFKPYKNICYLVKYIIQGLYASGILYPSRIICFRHFISFRDYMIRAFHILQGLYPSRIICFRHSTSRTLYFIISLSFCTNTHLYLTGITSSGVWTTGLNTSYFTYEFSSIWILHWPIISTSTICGSNLPLLFLVILRANMLSTTILFLSYISLIFK